MKVLALDTCLDKTYVALADDEKILKSEIVPSNEEDYHSAYLISTVAKVLKFAGMTPRDVDLVAADIGPGSFTGIRACMTVAKVMARQLDIKTAGVSSLEILSEAGKCPVVLDARKNKAYIYDGRILGAIELEKVCELMKDRTLITEDRLLHLFNGGISYQSQNYPIGETLAKLALNKEKLDPQNLKPLYIQPPPIFGR